MRSERDKIHQHCEAKKQDYAAATDDFNRAQDLYYKHDLAALLNEAQVVEQQRIQEHGQLLAEYGRVIQVVTDFCTT